MTATVFLATAACKGCGVCLASCPERALRPEQKRRQRHHLQHRVNLLLKRRNATRAHGKAQIGVSGKFVRYQTENHEREEQRIDPEEQGR